MESRRRKYVILGAIALLATGATIGAISTNESSASAPGQIDDGAELLPQASITLEQAIAAAQQAESGTLGEVDLEMYEGKLVFNIDIGEWDVKVDAADGSILGKVSDD